MSKFISFNGSNERKWKEIIDDFFGDERDEVSIEVPHGNRVSKFSDTKCTISVWGYANKEAFNNRRGHRFSTVFEKSMSSGTSDGHCTFSGKGVVIYDKEIPVSEVLFDFENNKSMLITFYDSFHEYDDDEVFAFKELLKQYKEIVEKVKSEKDINDINRESLLDSTVIFLNNQLNGELEKEFKRTTNDYKRSLELIEDARISYLKRIKATKEYNERLTLLTERIRVSKKSRNDDKVKKELLSLYEIPEVDESKNIYVSSDEFLCITTKDIFIEEDKYKFKVGKVLIKINLENGKIIFESLEEDKVKGYWGANGYKYSVHPHIGCNNNPCWGNAEESIAELIAEKEISALVIMIISFLQSVNVDDSAGRRVFEWPHKIMQPHKFIDSDDEYTEINENAKDACICHCCEEFSEAVGECRECDRYYCEHCQSETDRVCMNCFNEGEMCHVCGESCTDYRECDSCGEYVCHNCSTKCDVCDEVVCDECKLVCRDCGNDVCGDCCTRCDACDEVVCNECKLVCGDCGKDFCDEHSVVCDVCESIVCDNCSTNCSVCDDTLCDSCSITCEDCGEETCKNCSDDGVCEDCRGECNCEAECEKYTCDICKSEVCGCNCHQDGGNIVCIDCQEGLEVEEICSICSICSICEVNKEDLIDSVCKECRERFI